MKYQANPVIVDAEIIVGTGTILSDGSVRCALQNGENKTATKEMISRGSFLTRKAGTIGSHSPMATSI